MPPNTVKVDRSNRFFGNPFPVIDLMEGKNLKYWPVFQSGIEPAMAVDLFQIYLKHRPRLVEQIKRELRGKNLACWCKIGEPCHADVLLRVANYDYTTAGSYIEKR